MYLNISLQETSTMKNFESIVFTFENFQEAYVDASYIDTLHLCSSNYGNDYSSVMIVFNQSFKCENEDIFNRLYNRSDIVYIDINCKDESKNMEILVPYEENEGGFNKLQNIDYVENGQVFLEIGRERGMIE